MVSRPQIDIKYIPSADNLNILTPAIANSIRDSGVLKHLRTLAFSLVIRDKMRKMKLGLEWFCGLLEYIGDCPMLEAIMFVMEHDELEPTGLSKRQRRRRGMKERKEVLRLVNIGEGCFDHGFHQKKHYWKEEGMLVQTLRHGGSMSRRLCL